MSFYEYKSILIYHFWKKKWERVYLWLDPLNVLGDTSLVGKGFFSVGLGWFIFWGERLFVFRLVCVFVLRVGFCGCGWWWVLEVCELRAVVCEKRG